MYYHSKQIKQSDKSVLFIILHVHKNGEGKKEEKTNKLGHISLIIIFKKREFM